jgi:hypothetical protein
MKYTDDYILGVVSMEVYWNRDMATNTFCLMRAYYLCTAPQFDDNIFVSKVCLWIANKYEDTWPFASNVIDGMIFKKYRYTPKQYVDMERRILYALDFSLGHRTVASCDFSDKISKPLIRVLICLAHDDLRDEEQARDIERMIVDRRVSNSLARHMVEKLSHSNLKRIASQFTNIRAHTMELRSRP